MAELIEREEIRELIQDVLDRANAKYAQVEQIKKFALLDHDLTQENGDAHADTEAQAQRRQRTVRRRVRGAVWLSSSATSAER